MTCGRCVSSVQSEVSTIDGVTDVDVDLTAAELSVLSDTPVDPDAVRSAVGQARYESSPDLPPGWRSSASRPLPAGPTPTPTVHTDHEESPMSSTTPTPTPTTHTGHGGQPTSMAGYRIDAPSTVVTARQPQGFTFRVLDPGGATVTGFEDRHERPMHLIVVSNDLGDYAHLHPQLADDGTWSAELPALVAGGYRVIADTVPADGPDLVLTVDLVVPGIAAGRPLPDPADTAVVDDLAVTLALAPTANGLTAALTVHRDGAVVEPDPYLGARGHLVAIEADDLGYLHVHPTDGDGPVTFAIADPAPGRYRLFFDFSVDGQVRTAAFTVDIQDVSTVAPAEGHGHSDGAEHR